MLSPLTIVSLDQGRLYGPGPTIDELEAGMIEDLGFAPGTAEPKPGPTLSRGRSGWTTRLREWLGARTGRAQPTF